MEKHYQGGRFLYGVVYYPEQWPEARWDTDLARIADTGMNVVRMGEGAWSVWEPEEGHYDFSVFDRALDLCGRHNLRAIMGTPTYTPPAWLTGRYPEVLRASYDGTRLAHGSRRHYNYTSAVYLEKARAVTEALAGHYQNHPAVIGWQIDNELNCHLDVSFAESDHQAFRAWCRQRYGTLGALNQAWGTAFWSQTYTEWDQVCLPKHTVTYQNPSLLLDFYRFTSASAVRFAAAQFEILKRIAPHQFVTHNAFHGMKKVSLSHLVGEALDFLSYDSYPAFQVCDVTLPRHFRDRFQSRYLAKVRGVSRKFVVLEQQSGPSGQIGGLLNGNPDYLHPTPKPGQMRLWCWNSIANGADGVVYFRWRSLPYGSEAHWNGLLYHDERNAWRLEEAKKLGSEIQRLSTTLLGTDCAASAAILYDFDNEAHAEIESYTGRHRAAAELAVYQALSERHLAADLLELSTVRNGSDLAGYKVVFFPHAHVLTAGDAGILQGYVEAGGTLVFGCWSGYRDRNHWCYDAAGRAFYEQLAGVRVADFTTVTPGETSSIRFHQAESSVAAPIFNEVLAIEGEQAGMLAAYTSDYYAGQPAVTLNRKGEGRVVHFGTFFSHENVTALLEALGVTDPLQAWAEIPPEIDVMVRSNGVERFCFLLNFTGHSHHVHFWEPSMDILGQRKLEGEEHIPPYGVILARC